MEEKVNLPSSWEKCSFGDIVYVKYGYAFQSNTFSKAKNAETDVPLVRQSQLKDTHIDLTEAVFLPRYYLEKYSNYIIKKGDVIIGMSGAIGKVCVYTYDIPALQNQRTGKIVPYLRSELNPNFFGLYLSNIEYELTKYARGVGVQNISAKDIEKLPFFLPPLPEQHRIVAKIEELFSELDKGVESLRTAQAQLKVYRQSLLKHAFEGKLTAQWRAEHAGQLEDAATLLERIRAERAARYEAEVAEWEAGGKDGRKPNLPKELPPLREEELAELPELPDGWGWDKLGWMTLGVEYGTSAKSSEQGSHPVLRMGNIQNGQFDWSDLVYTSDPEEIEAYLLRDEDVLFNRTNSPELVGKSAIYKMERPAIFAGYLIRINQIKSIVNSQYLNLFLNSSVAKNHGNRVKTDGVNQSNINGEKLRNYPFPFCSLKEQDTIVEILDNRLSIIDKFEQEIEVNLVRADALRQAILKKAFAGQLVPQDPTDEPASVLLERIRAARESGSSA